MKKIRYINLFSCVRFACMCACLRVHVYWSDVHVHVFVSLISSVLILKPWRLGGCFSGAPGLRCRQRSTISCGSSKAASCTACLPTLCFLCHSYITVVQFLCFFSHLLRSHAPNLFVCGIFYVLSLHYQYKSFDVLLFPQLPSCLLQRLQNSNHKYTTSGT